MFQKELRGLGLQSEEAKVYDALLRFPNTTVTETARHANLNRAAVEKALRSLSRSRLVRTQVSGKRKTYAVTDPTALQARITAQQHGLDALLPTLQTAFAAQGSTQSIAIYEGIDGIVQVIDSAVQTAPYLKSFSSPENFYGVLGEAQANQWVNVITERQIESRSLCSDTPGNRELIPHLNRSNNTFRPLPGGIAHPIEIIVYEQTIAFTSWYRQFSVRMESPEVAHFVEALFDDLWEQASNTMSV